MALRITTETDVRTVVHVDGRLAVENVAELERVCRPLKGPITLNLTNLLSVDDRGIKAVREIEKRGAEIVGASPYIQLLLLNDGE